MAAWTGPDLAWAGACRPAWVAPRPRALGRAPGCVAHLVSRLGASRAWSAGLGAPELAGVAADQRREEERGEKRKKRKKEEKKRGDKRDPGERKKRERKRKISSVLEFFGGRNPII